VAALKIEYILSITAVFTLLLNLLLTRYLINDKLYKNPIESKKGDVINFVLTPVIKGSGAVDTEALSTEFISEGDP